MKRLSRIKPYGVTALLTLISIVLMTLALKIYPFGDKAFLWTDGDQYFSFAHYFGSIGGKDDIFYSWSNALGGNAFIQLAYYSFSPFNLIFLILKDHMMLAAHIVAYIKIITASLAFFYCLDYLHNVIWHGLNSNAWFNYRYSFFMSFVLLLIAYDSYSLIMAGSVSKSEYMKAGAVLLAFAAFVINDAGDKLRPNAVTSRS